VWPGEVWGLVDRARCNQPRVVVGTRMTVGVDVQRRVAPESEPTVEMVERLVVAVGCTADGCDE
jgi:hypothetical protein